MSDPVLKISKLVKRFGGILASDQIDMQLMPHELHAVIGPNGAGKTTLIAQIAGDVVPDSGTIHVAGADITHLPPNRRAGLGLARSFQITRIFHDMSALDNVALAVQARDGHSFRFLRPTHTDPALRTPARQCLDQVGLGECADLAAGTLSHGDKRLLEIAIALATNPRLLLLDEPMAGMGPDESARMIALLNSLKGTIPILLVEHDMDAVFALADQITVLVYGRVIACGPPAAIRTDSAVRRAYLGDEAAQ